MKRYKFDAYVLLELMLLALLFEFVLFVGYAGHTWWGTW